MEIKIIKKDKTIENYDVEKILSAVSKSAERIMYTFTEKEKNKIKRTANKKIKALKQEEVDISTVHKIVESTLDEVNENVAKSYREYRNYKQNFVKILDKVFQKDQSIRYIGDRENSNTDSALVATKRCLTYNQLNKELYKLFNLNTEELQACKDGYIWIHDMVARRDTMNCFHRATRFITSTGVKSFKDFSDGDEITVLSHKGIWRKAIVREYGWQPIQEVSFKRACGKTKTVKVTANHRWILKDGTETTQLKVGDKLIATPDITNFDWNELSRTEKKLWCLGFSFADGSVVNNNNYPTLVIRLCKDKTRFAYRFNDVGYNVTYPESLNGDGRVIIEDKHSKDIPYLELDYTNIKYFMNGFMCADGNYNLNGTNSEFRGVQVTGEFNNYIYDLLNISGYYVTNIKDLTNQVTNYGIRKRETKSYGLYSNCGDRTWVVTDIKPAKLNPKSRVWCLEVEEDHSFLLEGGIPTGNCCLFDMAKVLKGGFEMGNIWYNEPKTLDVAFDVIGDVIISVAAQQYGQLS